jgi:hypothetical protein
MIIKFWVPRNAVVESFLRYYWSTSIWRIFLIVFGLKTFCVNSNHFEVTFHCITRKLEAHCVCLDWFIDWLLYILEFQLRSVWCKKFVEQRKYTVDMKHTHLVRPTFETYINVENELTGVWNTLLATFCILREEIKYFSGTANFCICMNLWNLWRSSNRTSSVDWNQLSMFYL